MIKFLRTNPREWKVEDIVHLKILSLLEESPGIWALVVEELEDDCENVKPMGNRLTLPM